MCVLVLCMYVCAGIRPVLFSLAPVAVGEISLLLTRDVVSLDWSQTFQLNGVLFHYDLRRNRILLSRSLATSVTLAQEPLDQGTNQAPATTSCLGGVLCC